ncbi:MAG: 5'-3' exoribonuclease [Firmicutes bacterium]|nr:5'-3' exoribonuclease [candidate division NPL-UPA2 bacterium]
MLDLHTHSSASDGADAPRELVRQAKERGLKGIALTDHDTCAGLEEAFAAGLELGLWVLPGVELSAEWGDEDVHILGYWISASHRELSDLMLKLRANRASRMARIVARLGELGLTISLSEVNAQSDQDGYSLGRPHIARALVARGYVRSMSEAFDLYLERGRPAYVPRYKLSPQEAIGAIVRSGGVAVWAHPGHLASQLLLPMVQAGLAGMEVYHPQHDTRQEQALLRLAKYYELVVTAGSDAHSAAALGAKRASLDTWYQLWSCR